MSLRSVPRTLCNEERVEVVVGLQYAEVERFVTVFESRGGGGEVDGLEV